MMTTPVFTNGQEGYACYRIPSIVRAVDGTLLAFAEGRRDNCDDHGGAIRIVTKRSRDNGLTWSDLVVVGENGEAVAASPSPVVDEQSGMVFLIFGRTAFSEFDVTLGKGQRNLFVTCSHDQGISWTGPLDITDQVMRQDLGWRQAVTAVGHAIQLRSGRLFFTAHVSLKGNDVFHAQNYVFWSDDHGKSWTIGGINPAIGCNESIAVELEDGSVMINARAYQDGRPTGLRSVMIYSFDDQGNLSMRPPYLDPQLVTPTVASSLIRYSWAKGSDLQTGTAHRDDRGILLYSGPDDPCQRVKMAVRFSRDDGKTWSAPKVVDPGPASYSDLVVQSDAKVGLLYERGNQGGIVYTNFPVDWVFG